MHGPFSLPPQLRFLAPKDVVREQEMTGLLMRLVVHPSLTQGGGDDRRPFVKCEAVALRFVQSLLSVSRGRPFRSQAVDFDMLAPPT